MPQDIPTTCDSYGKKFLIEHALLCPKGGLVLAQHDDTEKDWEALRYRALIPSAITYKSIINIRRVQGERNRSGSRKDGGKANDGVETVGETHGE